MSLLCSWGLHSWRFIAMGPRRAIEQPGYLHYVARLTERCRRCGLRRTNEYAPIPRRIRT